MTCESPGISAEQLQELLSGEWEDAAVFLALAKRQEPGRIETLLRRLYMEEQAHADYLKGVCSIHIGSSPMPRAIPEETVPVETILRRCYGRQMRRLAAYEARSRGAFSSPDFTRLASQEREHCQILLELIKKLKKRS